MTRASAASEAASIAIDRAVAREELCQSSRAQRKAERSGKRGAAVGGGGGWGGGEYIVYNCEYLVSLTCLVKVFGCAATPISTLGLRELTASRRLVGGEFEWV